MSMKNLLVVILATEAARGIHVSYSHAETLDIQGKLLEAQCSRVDYNLITAQEAQFEDLEERHKEILAAAVSELQQLKPPPVVFTVSEKELLADFPDQRYYRDKKQEQYRSKHHSKNFRKK